MSDLNLSVRSQIKNAVESEVEFSVNFDDAWQWLEYSTKGNAKRVLTDNFEKTIDYLVVINSDKNLSGGRPTEEMHLTADCFKQLAMLSGTPKGKEVRLYFIACERELKELKSLPAKPADIVFMLEEAAAAIKKERALTAAAESKIVEMKPKVEMYNILLEANKAIKIGEFADLINVKKLGQNNLFKFLRTAGILDQQNKPYQKYMHHFNVVQKVNKHTGDVYSVVLVTPGGQQFLVKKILEAGHTIKSSVVNEIIEAAAADKAA
ncbi:phage antirepressor KilAC domain-containing protein [Nostoc sphaeroides CHAB 2801]|uniref:phage antirepressor KilAC domain-containing protein n=1 Tax=Nostoc sphaeroides TaxID=446679 RepID=UPI000E4C2EAB|nr:phage antirepressor KilAC domain-containing protein [Nostoc sphaeroides]MCC5631710.1 phage antirepressor KilAC domain-containing protein [Nostoc sphaeroides CHAB 2801]